MNQQKDLWESLAKKNAKYYVYSDKGKGVSDEDFWNSGYYDYERLIGKDDLLKKAGVFLEIGCGIGRMTKAIQRIYPEVIGTDISNEMIKQAKKNVWGNNKYTFIETDGLTLPLEDNLADVAFSYIVFPHMKTREMIESNFKEVYRVLKPKGVFKVQMRKDDRDNLDQWWGGVRWNDKSIKELSSRIGFKLLKLEVIDHSGYWVWLQK